MSPIRAVWFDVGEVLINETREYGTWADWLGIPRHTFSAVFGAVIARGEDYREVFRYFRPDFDLDAARQARLDEGLGEYLNGLDLYPDIRPCLQALKDTGYFVGIAGNQTTRAGQFLRELNLPCDVLATSEDWGLTKPNRAFFSKLIAVSGHQRARSPTSATASTTTFAPRPRPACVPSSFAVARGVTSSTSVAARSWNSVHLTNCSSGSKPCPPTNTDILVVCEAGRPPGASGVLNRQPTGDPGTSVRRSTDPKCSSRCLLAVLCGVRVRPHRAGCLINRAIH